MVQIARIRGEIFLRLRPHMSCVRMHGDDVIDVGEVITGYSVTG